MMVQKIQQNKSKVKKENQQTMEILQHNLDWQENKQQKKKEKKKNLTDFQR